ncbi:MAG: helix-turn-helix domain-containing protein [Nitrospirae bacterium]|nr:helix-turn-helix domain-containing protein [Nitrospirota bacterium]
MKTNLEPEDIQAIAEAVMECLKPSIAGNCKHEHEDIIFDKKSLATYLKVSESTINKMVSNKQLPHFKIQAGQSGGVRFRQREIDKWIQRQTIPEYNPFISKFR